MILTLDTKQGRLRMFQIYPPALIERLSAVSAWLNTVAIENRELNGGERASLMARPVQALGTCPGR